MTHRYSSNEEILRDAELIGPIKGWPHKDSVLARLADAVHPRGFAIYIAMWPDGAVCRLVVTADRDCPPSEQIVRAYRQYHERRGQDLGPPQEGA